MKKNLYACMDRHRKVMKLILMMKATFILSVLFALQVHAGVYSQQVRLSMTWEEASIKQIISEIKKNSEFSFVYSDADIAGVKCKNVSFKDAAVEDILNSCLKDTRLKFSIEEKTIVIWKDMTRLEKKEEKRIVKGVVVDKQGIPLPGATVVLKGTTSGVVSDSIGRFEIKLPERGVHVLVFSFVGMKKQEIAVEKKSFIRVVLEEDSEYLDDVVVTGYQTISKERATGAYAIVNAQTLEQKPTANIAAALNGLVPGLTLQSSSVGETPRFVIRGKGTLQDDQSDSDPLIVVDGFPISGYTEGSDPFATINPNDVESISVLKDAAATSIYGARAANGVIVITTKKGKAGSKLDISADAYWSVSSRVDLDYYFNMASAENQFRYVELVNKYVPINSASDPYTNSQYHRIYMSEPYRLIFERDLKHNITDADYQETRKRLIELGNRNVWKDDLNDYIFRNALRSQYNVALRGMTERMNYAFSASYDDEKGYLKGNDKQRIMLNMTTSAKLTKNLTFDISLHSMFSKANNNGADVATIKRNFSPWSRLVDDDGNFIHVPFDNTIYEPILNSVYEGKTPADWHYNPAEDRKYMDNDTKTVNYRVQGGFNYATTWGLNVSAKGQYEWRRYTNHQEYDPESYYVRNYYNTFSKLNEATGLYDSYFPQGGIFTDGGHVYEAYNLRGQADYTLNKDRHIFTVLAGMEVLSSTVETTPAITRYGYNKYTNSVATTIDYQSQQFTDIFGQQTSNPYQTLGSLSVWEDRFFSVYANVAYTFDDKYSFTASFRTDASNFQSKSQRDKFSPFWSIGGSWLLSREGFLKQINCIDQLKLRASFGVAGVAAGKKGTSSVTTVATNDGNVIFPGSNSINARGNETLTWEKSRTFNIGLDVSFFNHKLSGSIEFYNKYSYDVLSAASVPSISQGTDQAVFNNAEVLNRGVEFSLASDLRVAGDWKWRGTLNYAYNYNKVAKFNLTSPILPNDPGFVEGYPVDMILALKPAGYTSEGYVQLQGKDGALETILTQETTHASEYISRDLDESNWFYYIGSRTPKSDLSFTNQFIWKGLTLSFMITGRFGYYVNKGDYFETGTKQANYSKQLDNSFAVYDQGYADQKSYSAYPLYNDENWQTYNTLSTGMLFANLLFKNNYIKGDHIRLNEIYLGYDLPESLLSRQGVFSRINVYAQASNLGLIWSRNGDMDPDYPVGNIKPMPTFTFGLKLGFKNW
jgi:tonB-linked outer membrane protein, susC/ragA family